MSITTEESTSIRVVPTITGFSHIGLTVRDITVSEAWYADVLGLVRAFVEPHGTGEGYTVVMTRPGTGLFVGLDHHPGAEREMFSASRTGLDHLAFQLGNREDLDAWVTHLEAMGVEHGQVLETEQPAPHALMQFRDPDGVALELFWMGPEMPEQPHLAPRAGCAPRTTSELPHSQLDQQPTDSRYVDAILAEALTWQFVHEQRSEIAVEGARALTLDHDSAGGPAEAFMIKQEFCHVHAQGDFSLHATLPLALASSAERAGWVEPHYLVRTGRAPATVVMLYAPRDDRERDEVLRLVRASYEFALGSSRQIPRATQAPKFTHPNQQEGNVMSIVHVGPSDGEQSGGGPIRCRIIEDGSHTQHRLGLIEATVPAGPGSPPQHVHREHDEIFIMTEGRLRFTSGLDSVDAGVGSCVTIPAGTAHTFANPFDEPAKFICTLTPDQYVEYFRDLGRLAVDDRGLLNPVDIGHTMAKYATEVVR
jgi:mannose-6-phosphate isomerase-like protein (cupin superfamily)/catechol 2,3-dioxygenase-like lactoylglutathione lyase family enzyme